MYSAGRSEGAILPAIRQGSPLPRLLLAGAAWLLGAAAGPPPAAAAPPASAEVPSVQPPAAYRQSIAPLLGDPDALAAAAPGAEVLLEETIHWISAEGAHYRAEHRVARGGAGFAVGFLPSAQKIHLALARSRAAGGAWQAAAAQALLRPAGAAAELQLAFPGLGADGLAETVVLVEEPVLPIPGELTALLTFYGERPTALSRAVVELPAAMAARLADTPVGAAPPPRRLAAKDGRIRLEWRLEPPPAGRSAAVWLTTLESWERLADWYRGQLRGRAGLPADLAAQARSWTAGAKDPREAAALLYRRVADAVATAPSELGLAPALPRRPAEVWAAGRGDSLDKAHLLQALLADQGIAATLALVNSRQQGAIETRSPDFRHFDHALLAIEIPGGRGPLWADPALPFLELGQLGAGDGQRPAFLIPGAGGWRFATTPPASAPPVSPPQVAELARRGDPRLGPAIEAAIAGPGGDPARLARQVGDEVLRLEREGEEGAASRLYLALEAVAARRRELAPLAAELRRHFESAAAVGEQAEIARELAGLFAASPPPWWAETPFAPPADAAAAAARLAELEAAGAIAPFLRQAVHLLTTFPPGADFSRRLYQIGYTFAEHYPAAPQTGPLLALLARLPKSDPNHWEGVGLEGRRRVAAGRIDDALALYGGALADPQLPPAFVSVFKALKAEAQLRAGRVADAGASLSGLEEGADLSLPIVVDGLVQGALLELEQGRPEEALAYLRRLAEVDPAVVERSSSPRQAAALRQLAGEENAARRAWIAAGAWWPSWLELAASWARQEGEPAAAEAVDDGGPLIGDLELLGQRFGDLLARGERRAAFAILRRLARAARWDPQLALELSGSLVYLASARPELAAAIHQTAIVLHRSLPPFADREAAARSRLLLAAHLIDGGRPDEALEPLRDLLALKVGGQLEQRGLALLAMVALATGRGQEQAAAELERALAEESHFPAELRGAAILHLAELHQRLGHPLEERRLLERELALPAIAASAQQNELAERLAALRGGSDSLAEAFAAWRARFPLPVLDLAEPSSLADPRLAGQTIDQLLSGDGLATQNNGPAGPEESAEIRHFDPEKGPGGEPPAMGSPPSPSAERGAGGRGPSLSSTAERVKIAFLLAADSRRPSAARAAGLAAVLPELRALVPRQGRYREMLLALAEERRLPATLRSAAAFWLAYSHLQHENLAAADTFLARRGLDLTVQQRQTLAELRELPAAKPAAAGAGAAAALETYVAGRLVPGRKLSAVETPLFLEAWRYLALAGAEGAAASLAPRLGLLATAGGDPAPEAELRRAAGELLPELEALRRSLPLWRRQIPDAERPAGRPAARPPLADEIASPQALEALRPEDCRALLAYDLETFALGLAATPRWPAAYAACQESGEAGGRRQRDLALAVAGAPLGDAAKADALLATASQLADDDPAWSSLLAGLAGLVDPRAQPRTGRVLRLLEAQQGLRRGEEPDWTRLGADLEPPLAALAATSRARLLLHRRDAAGARAFLDALSPAELESPAGMLERLALLALAPGPQAQKERLRAAARRQLYEAQLAALAAGSWSEGRRAIRLAQALDGRAGYPPDFVSQLLAVAENPLGRLSLELADAEARQDWPAAAAAAERMIELESPDHDDLWNLGRAAFLAGQKEKAQAALRLFLEKTRFHPDEKEARALLARLPS